MIFRIGAVLLILLHFGESFKVSKVPVLLNPGLESSTPGLKDVLEGERKCPLTSVCVPSNLCLRGVIYLNAQAIKKKFTCGSNRKTKEEYVCCSIRTIAEDMGFKKPHSVSNYHEDSAASLERRDDEHLSWGSPETNNVANTDLDDSVSSDSMDQELASRSSISETEEPWECGVTLESSSEKSRIYAPLKDGSAKEGAFPWHVAILTLSYTYLCSGVIIGEKTVLTVAHCLDNQNISELLVRVGELDLTKENEVNEAFDVRVSLITIHPDYSNYTLEADIAILELEYSVRALHHVRPACLPGKHSPSIDRCKVPGWGQTILSKDNSHDPLSSVLREASFYIIDKGVCQNIFRNQGDLGAFFQLQNSALCAKGYINADTCKGDGGSGLVCIYHGIFILKGLVSYGLGCGLNMPGVFTDVESFLPFIENYKSLPEFEKNDSIRYQPVVNQFTPIYEPNFEDNYFHPRTPTNEGDFSSFPTSDSPKEEIVSDFGSTLFREDILPTETPAFDGASKYSDGINFGDSYSHSQLNSPDSNGPNHLTESKEIDGFSWYSDSAGSNGPNRYPYSKGFVDHNKYPDSTGFEWPNRYTDSAEFDGPNSFTDSAELEDSNEYTDSTEFVSSNRYTESVDSNHNTGNLGFNNHFSYPDQAKLDGSINHYSNFGSHLGQLDELDDSKHVAQNGKLPRYPPYMFGFAYPPNRPHPLTGITPDRNINPQLKEDSDHSKPFHTNAEKNVGPPKLLKLLKESYRGPGTFSFKSPSNNNKNIPLALLNRFI